MHAITLRFLAEPADVNYGGMVHGGAVMRWIDQAGYTCAVNWSGRYCVTVYVGGIRFHHPIRIGHLVEAEARLIHTGTTSMHIAVDIHARDPRNNKREKTTHCIIVFVAMDDERKPVAVPRWSPGTDEEKALSTYAVRLMGMREEIEDAMRPHLTGGGLQDSSATG
ncbi:MAG TPA: acyl-CoA thioesterase [Flavobacteriales bacterium]|nr:acyl-CoA thioesterase [Flavobacteriales bacterium]HMR26360.1 acyl-CoA thioesterase [Flavobacteriales bacterium]